MTRGGWRRDALVGVALAAAGAVALGVWAWRAPLTFAHVLDRSLLLAGGLTWAEVPGERGPQVVWSGGEGETVVLLHELGQRAGAWGGVVARMVANRRLIAPDLPGHGWSGPADPPLGFEDWTAAMELLLTDEPSPVVIVGHGVGGLLAVELALAHPDRVSRLVLVDCPALAAPLQREAVLPATPEALGRPDLSALRIQAELEALRDPRYASLFADLPPAPDLTRVAVPVTLVWGERRRARVDLADPDVVELEHCGHDMPRTCAEELAQLLLTLP